MTSPYATSASFSMVLSILQRIEQTKSLNVKKAIIEENAGNVLFIRVVYYALDPYKTFKMSGSIESLETQGDTSTQDIFACLDQFASKKALTDQDKQTFHDLVGHAGASCVDVINRILNKSLKCGAGHKLFYDAHKVFADLPYHHPMKGGDDFKKFYAKSKDRDNICWSYKLDGTRTWAIADVKTRAVTYLSFNGHELPNFSVFDGEVLHAAKEACRVHPELKHTVIFDGECTYYGGDFSKHMSNFRRLQDVDPSGFRFRIFDIANLDLVFSQRYEALQRIALIAWEPCAKPGQDDDIDASGIKVTFLPHMPLDRHPDALTRSAIALGLEGIMMKTWDHKYMNKRSLAWCKHKLFSTEDLPVVGLFEGRGKYEHMLGGLIVLRNNVRTEVGSGFTDVERAEFWKCPPKMIEVKFQEALESGKLRFPVFMRVRDDKD